MAVDEAAYRRVIQSARWRTLRARLINQRGPRCERCGKSWGPGYPPKLQLHHTTYERLGHERDGDVQLVCESCHVHADQERSIDARERSARALYNARLNGWATAKYGEDWDYRDGDIVDEFNDWLEHNGD